MINPGEKYQHTNIPFSIDKYEEISNRIPDITKAQKLLGFEPKINLKEGLAKTINWQKKE
jgi:dTDP-glucose 4,6-dehydratase